MPVRLAIVVLGLALAVYGAASLTGGWLDSTSRDCVLWKRTEEMNLRGPLPAEIPPEAVFHSGNGWVAVDRSFKLPHAGFSGTSAGVFAAGLALAAVAGWPR